MMRVVLLALGLACVAPSSAQAFTGLRGDGCQGSNTSSMTANCAFLAADVDAGDVCVLLISVRDSATATVASMDDDQSVNNWTQRVRNATGGQFVEAWTSIAQSGNATTVTTTYSGNVNSQVNGHCFSGSPATIQVPSTNTGSASSATSHPCGSVSGLAGDLLITVSSESASGGTLTAATGDGYATLLASTRSFTQYQILSTSLTSSATWTGTTAVNTTSAHIVIRDGAASSAVTPRGTLLGVLP